MKDLRCVLGLHKDHPAPATSVGLVEQGHARLECVRCGRSKTIKISSKPADRGGYMGEAGGGGPHGG